MVYPAVSAGDAALGYVSISAQDHFALGLPLAPKQYSELGYKIMPPNVLVLTKVLEYLIRISLGPQGYIMWLDNEEFDNLVGAGPQRLPSSKTKGLSYLIPQRLQESDGTQHYNPDRHCRIGLSIRGSKQTLVAIDHNMILQFHVRKLSRPTTAADLETTSAVREVFVLPPNNNTELSYR